MHLLLVLQQITSPELSTNLLSKYVERKFFIYLSIKIKMVCFKYSFSKRFIYCIVLLKLIEEVVVLRRLHAAYLPGMGRAGGQRRPPPTRPVQGVVVVVMPRMALICPITCTAARRL